MQMLQSPRPSAFVAPSVTVVFVQVDTTGRHSGTDVIGLHEAIVARARVEASGEGMTISGVWPNHVPQEAERDVATEYKRLCVKYKPGPNEPDWMKTFYGELHTGRLKSVCDRILKAFRMGIPVHEIVELGRPENDAMEFRAEAGPVPNGIVKPGATEPEDTRPSGVDLTQDDGDVPGIGGDDTPEEEPIDGSLILFLCDLGWNEPDATAVARLVKDHGIKQITDEHLKDIRGFQKPDARKRLRQHLIEYPGKPAAAG